MQASANVPFDEKVAAVWVVCVNVRHFHLHLFLLLSNCTPRQNPCTCKPTVLDNKADPDFIFHEAHQKLISIMKGLGKATVL